MDVLEHVEAHLRSPQCISTGMALIAANRGLCIARIPVIWHSTARLDEPIDEGNNSRFDGISTQWS